MNTSLTLSRFALLTGLLAFSPVALFADDDYDYGDPVSFDEGIDLLEQGWDDAYVSVEGVPLQIIDSDEYRFDIEGTEVLLDISEFDHLDLLLDEAIRVTGELEFADEDDAPGLLYELDAEALLTLDGQPIAVIDEDDDYRDDEDDDYRDEDDDDYRDEDDDDYRDDDDDDYRDDDDDDYRDEDDDDYRDDDYDDYRDEDDDDILSMDEAILRLQEGWDEAYVSVEGIPVAMLDEDEYRFAVDGLELLLDLWDDVELAIDETIRVTGELEFADEGDVNGFAYELDAMWIEDLDGNRIGEDDNSGRDRDEDDHNDRYGDRVEGTLAELIGILEARNEDDLNVRTIGTLGERAGEAYDEDDDFLFSDESGVTVILDLDSRADMSFSLSPGTVIEVIGELEAVDTDDVVPEGILYELDAVHIQLADGTSLDVGQQTLLSGATISDWMGYYWDLDDTGWYYHPSKGTLYSDRALGGSDWFLSANRGDWIYTNRQWYPLVYSHAEGWHYVIGSSYGDLQHAYSYNQDSWILDFWRMEQ